MNEYHRRKTDDTYSTDQRKAEEECDSIKFFRSGKKKQTQKRKTSTKNIGGQSRKVGKGIEEHGGGEQHWFGGKQEKEEIDGCRIGGR